MNERLIRDITDFIFVSDAPKPADIIFIPGGSFYPIAERAAELWHAGFAPLILPSGRYSSKLGRFARENLTKYQGEFETEFDFLRHVLMKNGVPDSAILREDRATNTGENAAFSAEVLRAHGLTVRRAILCCKSFHTRRALMTYAKHFPDAELLAAPADTQGIRREDWFLCEESFRKVLGELERCGRYFSDSFDSFPSPR